jgi:hypothetical protein
LGKFKGYLSLLLTRKQAFLNQKIKTDEQNEILVVA